MKLYENIRFSVSRWKTLAKINENTSSSEQLIDDTFNKFVKFVTDLENDQSAYRLEEGLKKILEEKFPDYEFSIDNSYQTPYEGSGDGVLKLQGKDILKYEIDTETHVIETKPVNENNLKAAIGTVLSAT